MSLLQPHTPLRPGRRILQLWVRRSVKGHGAKISMTENGDPLENAVAERINGILTGEYLECYAVDDFQQAEKLLDAVIGRT